MSVFIFKVWYDYDDIAKYGFQERFVIAGSQEEAERKLEQYNESQVKKGFAPFKIGRGEVYIQEVIM